MEHPDYRNNIEQLNNRFPGKEMLGAAEIMEVYGYKSQSSVKRNFGKYLVKGRVSKATLARLMCGKR